MESKDDEAIDILFGGVRQKPFGDIRDRIDAVEKLKAEYPEVAEQIQKKFEEVERRHWESITRRWFGGR